MHCLHSFFMKTIIIYICLLWELGICFVNGTLFHNCTVAKLLTCFFGVICCLILPYFTITQTRKVLTTLHCCLNSLSSLLILWSLYLQVTAAVVQHFALKMWRTVAKIQNSAVKLLLLLLHYPEFYYTLLSGHQCLVKSSESKGKNHFLPFFLTVCCQTSVCRIC